MAQAVSCQPYTTEARDRSRHSSCEIYGKQSGTGRDFFFVPGFWGFTSHCQSTRCCLLIFMYLLLLPKGQTDPAGIFGAMGVGGGEEKITEIGDHCTESTLL